MRKGVVILPHRRRAGERPARPGGEQDQSCWARSIPFARSAPDRRAEKVERGAETESIASRTDQRSNSRLRRCYFGRPVGRPMRLVGCTSQTLRSPSWQPSGRHWTPGWHGSIVRSLSHRPTASSWAPTSLTVWAPTSLTVPGNRHVWKNNG